MPRRPHPGDPRHYAEDIHRLQSQIEYLLNQRDQAIRERDISNEQATRLLQELKFTRSQRDAYERLVMEYPKAIVLAWLKVTASLECNHCGHNAGSCGHG